MGRWKWKGKGYQNEGKGGYAIGARLESKHRLIESQLKSAWATAFSGGFLGLLLLSVWSEMK